MRSETLSSAQLTSPETTNLRAMHLVTFRALSVSVSFTPACCHLRVSARPFPPVGDLPLQATSPGPLLCSQASFAHSWRQEK